MIYFDNAATGGFKPRAVSDAVCTVMRYLCANPGRSGHRLSLVGAEILQNTRSFLADYFGAKEDHVIFTKNCTEALNLAIFGSLKSGGHVITTVLEHNSVLRPLTALKEKGLIELDVVSERGYSSLYEAVLDKIKPNTYLIAITAVSNVTGEKTPFEKLGKLARERGILLLVDGAQGGGHVPINLEAHGISMLALAGHKGLYGIMGSGVLIFDENVELSPLLYGGTGSESFNLNQPKALPERLEAGTLNLPAIAGLFEGAKFIKSNQEIFARHLYSYTEFLITALNKMDGVTVYSKPNSSGIVSFKLNDMPSNEVADLLNSEYDIAVRGGFHCAPLIHKYLNTQDDGLVRASLAVQNSTREINFFIRSIDNIIKR